VDDFETQTWSAPAVEVPISDALIAAERQLSLVDRVLGLEAQVAELAVTTSLTPTEQLLVEQQLVRLQESSALRIGRIATLPARLARDAARKVSGR
jgi:hypothetical protein